MKSIYIITTFLICTLLNGCSSSRLLSSRTDSSFDNASISTILVVGIAEDETKRRIYENTFVGSFQAAGKKAVASYTVSKQSIEPTEEALRAALKKSGAATILITHLVHENEKSFYQPTNMVIGTNSYPTGLYHYYPFIYNSVYSAGNYVSTTKVVLETSLYKVSTEKLIWTARSESIDPVMTRKYYQELIDLFIQDMGKNNIL